MPTAVPVVAVSDSAPSTSETGPGRSFRRDSAPVSGASRRPSDPSDFDWISPFTLPPLPALRRSRHPDTLRSPEQLRQRDESGTYYAAAWGSPYASPSSSRQPSILVAAAGRSTGRRSRSPSTGAAERSAPHYRRRLRHSVDLGTTGSPEATGKLRARKQLLKLLNKSERPNWLSDSESSGEEEETSEQEPTPKGRRPVSDWTTLSSERRSSSAQPATRLSSDSIDTVTPATFLPTPWPNRPSSIRSPIRADSGAMFNAGESASATAKATAPTSINLLPNEQPARQTSSSGDVTTQHPQSPTRSSPTRSLQQRQQQQQQQQPEQPQQQPPPKKKVHYNGKNYFIHLPRTDRESLDLPPILTAQELREKLDGLAAQGYHVSGFDLPPVHEGLLGGQSRPGFPSSEQIQSERQLRQFTVSIPNQQEWEDMISRLQEEKLRSLGVSPSSSVAPPSVVSPLSQCLSRSSSKYTGPLHSPAVAPSSVGSDHLRTRSTAFSPTYSLSSILNSQAGIAASSKHNGFHAPIHAYKHSLALASGRVNSPPDLGAMKPAAFVQPKWQPADVFVRGTDDFPATGPQAVCSLNEVCLPAVGTDAQRSPSTPNAPSNQFAYPGAIPPHALPQTPTFEPVVKKTPVEIQHPTPRSHRHNLSAALQKEIDDAEAALARQSQQPSPILEREVRLPASGDEEKTEDDAHQELPILRRPEIVEDEKSEIITNPSMTPSPLLDQDNGPMTDWQALSNAAVGAQYASYGGHKQQPSLALNVQAKEFDPRAGFQGSNFKFTGSTFQPTSEALPPPSMVVRKTRGPSPRQVSDSRFNVDAPSFVPKRQSIAPRTISQFSFSSSFNVDAPEFHPGTSFCATAGQLESSAGTTADATSIFGKVQIEPNSKVQRRASKPLQVSRPRSSGDRQSQSPRQDDDDGRPAPPTDRAKRVRREGSADASGPAFAPSQPLLASDITPELIDDSDVKHGSPTLSHKEPIDGWAYVPADESEITHEKTAQSPLPLSPQKLAQGVHEFISSSEKRDLTESGKPHERSSNSPLLPHSPIGETVEVYEELSDLPSSPNPSLPPPSAQKHKSSLSAAAEPFIFTPRQEGVAQPHSGSQPRIASGLAASRWAVSPPSPPLLPSDPVLAPLTQRQSVADPIALSSQSDSALKNEADEEMLRKSVKVTEDSSDSDEDELSSPLSSQQHQASEEYRVHEGLPSSHASPARSTAPFAVAAASAAYEEDSIAEDDLQPSFEEIDAVMKQFENDPELGIERDGSPANAALGEVQSLSNVLSGARSLSPHRTLPQSELVPSDAASAPPDGLHIGVHHLKPAKEEISDWDDDLSSPDRARVASRAHLFDHHVKTLVDGALDGRLAPLEHTLHSIQHSISLLATKPLSHRPLSMATEIKDSDADDEDDPDRDDAFQAKRSRAPGAGRSSRRTSQLRAVVAEAISAYKENLSPPPVTADLSAVIAEIADLRNLVEQQRVASTSKVADHPGHVKDPDGHCDGEDDAASHSELTVRIDELEVMLKQEQQRSELESLRRQKSDAEVELLKQALEHANAEAAEYKESHEQANQRLLAFIQEKAAYQELQHTVQGLEKMIEEHRKLKEELEDALEEEKGKNRELSRSVFEVKDQLTERVQRCHSLHSKVDRLREQISAAASGLAAEQSESRTREHELKTKVSIIENALDQATRHAERVQLDMDALQRQQKEILPFRDRFKNLQVEYTKAQELIGGLRNECRENEDKVHRLERQLNESQSVRDAHAATTIARLTAELEASKAQFESYKAEAESHVGRLQSRLDLADQDFEDQKVKNDTLLAEMHDAHANAIRELNEKHQQAVEELHAAHDRKLGDLRERHTRAMHNSSDDRHRIEHQFNEKLTLAEDKIKHLEMKVSDLTDSLEITRSAARAAVEAATAKAAGAAHNLPTPANSVIASPPTRTASGSLSVLRGEPEKISVQSLRESIISLQEQLQNREQKIELLVAEIKTLDPDAPSRIKECETEIQWLRELLAVRMDEIQELIAILSLPDFDRTVVKDAAIRLKANLEMEQSIREKSTTGQPLASAVPTLSQIAAYAQSPRQALPLVANAALGNLRRAKQYAGDAYGSYLAQTPSRSSTMSSQASFLSSVITPPGSVAQTIRIDNGNGRHSPTIRPLAAAAAAAASASSDTAASKPLTQSRSSSGAEPVPRPLRGYSSNPRTLGKKSNPDTVEGNSSSAVPSIRSLSPQTPTWKPTKDPDLGDDVDEDASILVRTGLQLDEAEN